MVGRIAGFFSILAGALVAVGAFPTWVTINAAGTTSSYNALNIVGDYRDAIVSFVLAAVLLLAGFVLSVRPVLAARALGALGGIASAIWAGLLFFSLAPQAHSLIAPTGPSATTSIELGLWITAGGGLLGLLTALTAATARSRRVVVQPVPATRAPATAGPSAAAAEAPAAPPARPLAPAPSEAPEPRSAERQAYAPAAAPPAAARR